MELKVTQQGNKINIKVEGFIGELEAENLKNTFRELRLTPDSVISMDFEKVDHIGSAGLGKLLLIYKDVTMAEASFESIRTSSKVKELIKIVNLDKLFSVS